MKRIIIIVVLLLVPVFAFAEGLNLQQMQFRLEIVKFLASEGVESTIDRDGDVSFVIDDLKYHFIINENWSDPDPFLVTLYLGFIYDDIRTNENMQNCINLINQQKVVKLYCDEQSYAYRSDMFCKDIQAVKSSFRSILDQYRKSITLVDQVLNSDLKGIDIVIEKDKVFDYAMKLYSDGDYEPAVSFLNYLSDSGYEKAYGYLGMAYETGNGAERNEDKMIDFYNKAVKAGYNWCAYHLALHYEGKKEYDQAIKNYIQCSANEGTYRSAAFYSLGRMYENGMGVPANIESAVKHYQKSVQYSTVLESDARIALMRLGKEVEPLESFVKADPVKLRGLSLEDMFKKGLELENGLNGKFVSLSEAYSYFIAAADNGYPKAMIKIGDIYVNKYYPFNDINRSNKYYQKAFKALKKTYETDGEACYELGCMLYNGKGVEKDLNVAEELFKMSAAKGNPDASYMAGLQSLEELDYPEAYKYFKRAADAGVGMAMFELAKLYESGLGVRCDFDEAVKWYQKCYEVNCVSSSAAERALKRLNNNDGKY